MSVDEKKGNVDKKDLYSSPEIVCLGDALQLTAGGPGVVADGGFGKEHWQDGESSSPLSPTTTPTAKPG